jgi:hypothetical protein
VVVTGGIREILDIGETKFWAMVKAGKIKLAETGGRRLGSL